MLLTSQEFPRTRDFTHLKSLLRARKLDGTLGLLRPLPSDRVAETGLTTLDASLGGGLPHGHLSEIVGPRSSGRMSVLCAVLAAATRRGEVVALVDTFDSFDPVSGQASGIELSQLLWIRGRQGTSRELPHVIARAIKATELVLQAGGFGIVAMDLGEAPEAAIRRLPFTTWLRLARVIEGRETVGVVVGPVAMARSSAGRSVVLESRGSSTQWAGRLFRGLGIAAEVRSARFPATTLQLNAEEIGFTRE